MDLYLGVRLSIPYQHADPPHPVGQLCPRREGRRRHSPEEQDKFAPPQTQRDPGGPIWVMNRPTH